MVLFRILCFMFSYNIYTHILHSFYLLSFLTTTSLSPLWPISFFQYMISSDTSTSFYFFQWICCWCCCTKTNKKKKYNNEEIKTRKTTPKLVDHWKMCLLQCFVFRILSYFVFNIFSSYCVYNLFFSLYIIYYITLSLSHHILMYVFFFALSFRFGSF